MAVLTSKDLQPQTEADIKRVTKGPHTYVAATADTAAKYVAYGDPKNGNLEAPDAEFPRVMYRRRTAEEVSIERANLTQEQWLDKDVDLTQLTGHNQIKKVQNWEAYVTRPVEKIVHSAKEQKALGSDWTHSLKDALEAK